VADYKSTESRKKKPLERKENGKGTWGLFLSKSEEKRSRALRAQCIPTGKERFKESEVISGR